MANKTNKDNIKKVIITIVLVVLFALAGYVIVGEIKDAMAYEFDEAAEYSKYYASQTITPRNLSSMFSYNGVNDTTDLYISLRHFVKYTAKLKEELNGIEDAEELYKFFSENKDEIKAYTAITTEEEFFNYIIYIRKFNVEEEFKYAEITSGSAHEANNYFWVEIAFYYGDCEKSTYEPIKFEVGLAKKANNKVIVRYNIQKYTDPDYNKIDEEKEAIRNEILKNDSPGKNTEY